MTTKLSALEAAQNRVESARIARDAAQAAAVKSQAAVRVADNHYIRTKEGWANDHVRGTPKIQEAEDARVAAHAEYTKATTQLIVCDSGLNSAERERSQIENEPEKPAPPCPGELQGRYEDALKSLEKARDIFEGKCALHSAITKEISKAKMEREEMLAAQGEVNGGALAALSGKLEGLAFREEAVAKEITEALEYYQSSMKRHNAALNEIYGLEDQRCIEEVNAALRVFERQPLLALMRKIQTYKDAAAYAKTPAEYVRTGEEYRKAWQIFADVMSGQRFKLRAIVESARTGLAELEAEANSAIEK